MREQLSPEQTVPGIIELLHDYSITAQDIAMECNLDLDNVHDALSIFAFDSCPLFVIASVRCAFHHLLAERGWKGDKKKIWGKHDIRILFTGC